MGMWNDLQKWRKLSHTDRSVLLFAWLNIPWTAFSLKLHGFKRVHARLHTNRTHAPTTEAAADLDAALRMARLVDIANRKGLYEGNCLSRSLTLAQLLQRHGIAFDLKIGVRKNANKLEAHAWLECAGVPINDSADVGKRFLPMEGSLSDLRGLGL